MAISAHFNQEYTVITVDQALYPKLMELKWCSPEYQNKFFPRLGGLHISMNFLKAIGEHISGSGLKDVWVRSNVLEEGATELVLSRIAYNKGMRIHKLSSQALWCILIPQQVSFISDVNKEFYDLLIILIHLKDNITDLISLLMEDQFTCILKHFLEKEKKAM